MPDRRSTGQERTTDDGFRRPFSSGAEQVCCLRDGPGGCAAAAPDDGHARGCAVLRRNSLLPGSRGMLQGRLTIVFAVVPDASLISKSLCVCVRVCVRS